jgi:hypothetical protein
MLVTANKASNGAAAMTEDQIEREVELAMDRIDHRLITGRIDQAQYDHHVMLLDKWAENELRFKTEG